MICNLDSNDFCQRHKKIHTGRLKELALDPSPLGEKYRLIWDKQNALPKMIGGCDCYKKKE